MAKTPNANKQANKITLAHGSGGRLTHELVKNVFAKYFKNKILSRLDDAAVLGTYNKNIVFTTDAFVVNPLFFPGGDIGRLCICGTVNDLSVMGATPVAITVAAIIEEGLGFDVLERVAKSIALTAKEANVLIVGGDTKVVERGKGDKLFITTSGVGVLNVNAKFSGSNAKPGECVLLNGNIGDHEVAVIGARNEYGFLTNVKSDVAPLNGLIAKTLPFAGEISVMRDPTRGGLATTLNEIANMSNVGIIIEEKHIPISKQTKSVCQMLGLDPLYLANEGKVIVIAQESATSKIEKAMASHKYGRNTKIIGTVVNSPKGVWLKTLNGGLRPIVMLEGEQLPRIC
ncbi:MAG: hydrogenase expression/formation protein HypE [Endomicrobiales bacterium]|nr:hydrogenase expression/formation protein HypE [Endomicrobiales bacterium]